MDNNREVFLIPSLKSSEYSFLFFPRNKKIFYADKEDAFDIYDHVLRKDFSDKREIIDLRLKEIKAFKDIYVPSKLVPQEPKRALIILSERCNLNCEYCYAQKAHSNEVISKASLTAIADFILSNPGNKSSFSIIGGGEPLVEWNLLTFFTAYIEEHKGNQEVQISITTNATLLDTKKIEYIKDHRIGVNISFDILKDVQDAQRGFGVDGKSSFDIVDKNIKLLLEAGIRISIRSTITNRNVARMKEMVNYVIDNYPQVKSLHFEHVSMEGNDQSYYSVFLDSFFEAYDVAVSNGIRLKNSVLNAIHTLRSSFCKGEFTITPSDCISACHRVSSERDSLFHDLTYGVVQDGKVRFDDDKLDNARNYMMTSENECQQCFAKYGCAGGCIYNRNSYTTGEMDSFCEFVRAFYIRYFERTILNV